MSSYTYLFKFIIVGDSNVGKSCLMLQFTDNKFKSDNDPTIGVEFGSASIKHNESTLRLQIWDTAGQESFRSITRSYFRGAIGALLVFDLTSRESFTNLANWVEEIQMCASTNLVIILIGNKCDMTTQQEITIEEAEDFAKSKGLIFIQTSAKTSHNVEKAFRTVAELVVERIDKGQIDPENEGGIKVGNTKNQGSITLNQQQQNSNPDAESRANAGCSC
jgi:Ras-related protein Rab-2A